MTFLAHCVRCAWSQRVTCEVEAQDALMSHHNLEHGRPHQPVTLVLEPVEHDTPPLSLWARFRAWRNRPRCTCPRPSGILPPLHGGYRPHPQPPRPICLVHPPPPRPHPPIPPSGPGGGYNPRRKGTW